MKRLKTRKGDEDMDKEKMKKILCELQDFGGYITSSNEPQMDFENIPTCIDGTPRGDFNALIAKLEEEIDRLL